MVDTMKALIFQGDGFATERPENKVLAAMEPFVRLGDLPVPEPGEGQVRIKVALASVNPSDEMFIQGLYGQPRIKGNAAGFEGVGDVVASGGVPSPMATSANGSLSAPLLALPTRGANTPLRMPPPASPSSTASGTKTAPP